jgi:hypothetical protein
MMPHRTLAACVLLGFALLSPARAEYPLGDVTVVVDDRAPETVKTAADEIRSYVYRLTGSWPALAATPPAGKPAILLRTGPGEPVPTSGNAPDQNFALYPENGHQVVHGASPPATLWAAYELIQTWGVGFYLGGDAIPPADPKRTADLVTRTRQPTLAVRGNLPWFNFMNSPTTWNPQDYKTFFAQMAKQKANLILFHAYDHEPFGAYDITRTSATMGGPLMTTISPHRWWSPPIMATKDYLFGTGLFFDRGEWGCEVGIEEAWTFAPGHATKRQQQMMAHALAYARRLGIRTCLGWEVTKNPDDETVRRQFRKRLIHTLRTYPLDYFCMWQSEGRGVGGKKTGTTVGADVAEAFRYLGEGHDLSEAARITRFVRLAHATLQDLAPNVRLVVCGWGGDAHMRFSTLYIGLDKLVPDDVIFAALDNIDPRAQDHVSEAYGKLQPARERWPIPWFESDGGHTRIDQTGPQTNVTAFEPLLKDIADKGCQGALGIHWRTRNVEDVAGYLYRFAWDPTLTAERFFHQYATDHYGPDDAEEMTRIHLRLEEFGPQYVGARGTVECASGQFHWFWPGRSPLMGHGPNLAGELPDESRFDELASIQRDLLARSDAAAKARRRHAAIQYHDLAMTIRWLLIRAKVGLAIHNMAAPLEQRLGDAERREEAGDLETARRQAESVLHELEALDFKAAVEALATTCRTRGELGMLATANARYGRFYAGFVQRIAHILGRPLPESRSAAAWTGPDVVTVFPVPNRIASNEDIWFDAVLLPQHPNETSAIQLTDLNHPDDAPLRLPLQQLGGAYHRAVFVPPGAGAWAWQLVSASGRRQSIHGCRLPDGLITVGPPAERAHGLAVRDTPPTASLPPVLKLDFEQPPASLGRMVGNVGLTAGVRGKALDLRDGGSLFIDDAPPQIAFQGPFTIAFFVRPEPWGKSGSMPVLLGKGRWDGDGYFVQLYQRQIRVGLGRQRCLDAASLPSERWTHLAVVWEDRNLRLYVDGELIAATTIAGPLRPSSLPLRIGGYADTRSPNEYTFRGCLDELVFYDRALHDDEIALLAVAN